MGITEEAHNVKVLGSGEETVLLGHGFGSDQSVWRQLVPYLVDEFRVVLFDNIGAGTTNPEYYDFERYSTLDGYAHDVIAMLEELNVTSCIYVGHSFSTMVGVLASVARPDLFKKLILISPSPRFLNDEDYYGGFEKKDVDQLVGAMLSNYSAWCDGYAPLIVGGDIESPTVQEFSRTLFNMRPDISLSVLQTVFRTDMRPLLPRVTVPCHIIQSKNDQAVPLSVSEYLHQNLGGKSVVEITETEGHIPQLSAPEIAIPIILRQLHHDIPD